MNLDGIDDIGLWVKDRQGTLPRNSGEYFFWVSDRSDPNPAIVFDSYSPDPLGNDLFAEFGDELGLPIFGKFDPPVVGSGSDLNPLHNTPSPLDVDREGFVSPLDVLVVVNVLNSRSNSGSGEGEGSEKFIAGQDTSSVDAVFSQLGLDIEEEVVAKKRRR